MARYTKSDGTAIEANTEFTSPGVQPLIPAGTKLLSAVASSEVEPEDDFGNNEHFVLTLHVIEKGPFKDFTVKHKLHVNDDKEKKADKALDFVIAYDTNHKGLWKKANDADKEFDSALLARCLNGCEVLVTYDIWSMTRKVKNKETNEMEDVTFEGNFVKAVEPSTKTQPKQAPEPAKSQVNTIEDIDNDPLF